MPPSDELSPGAARCLTVSEIDERALRALLDRYGLLLQLVGEGEPIRASFWGEPEAGISGTTVYARGDTPVHSILHEASHVVCMSAARRESLHRDAGGTDIEEAAVCYLEILLAGHLPGVGRERLMRDMDAWGYSFRLGSTARWFHEDADDARRFLEGHGIVDSHREPTWRMRA